jgi:LAO/AO transport system kinase
MLKPQVKTPKEAPDSAARICAGDVRAASRLIRNIEDRLPEAKDKLKLLFPQTGRARVIGITGAPGAGKSTITDALISSYRQEDKQVGVLAVDPTSPFTGGAILGDRIRMQRHAEDPGVFIRSLATRGSLGGLSHAVSGAINVLDAMGKDIIIVETVGTGQQEVDIVNHAHTVVLILVPGMGDDIQAMKAGIMEIADIFLINKADREGAGQLAGILKAMLDLAGEIPGGWRQPILRTPNVTDAKAFAAGIRELTDKIYEHQQTLSQSGQWAEKNRRQASLKLEASLRAAILDRVMEDLTRKGEWMEMVKKITTKEADPYSLAEIVAGRYLKPLARGEE